VSPEPLLLKVRSGHKTIISDSLTPPTRGEGLVRQAQFLGLAEVLKPCNCVGEVYGQTMTTSTVCVHI